MVMDATQPQQPSPQSVGREFVRQYYTLLNKAPSHLHRFYNNNSSFIHGESNLVVGQREIHNRIQQLNFNDCHAKISQVDAQATLGNGVVVQVTGELSNDGQPMRRFTQTFVLAAQSPKKYYVHNDIFRYQDHLYTDDEADGETRSDNGEEHEASGNMIVPEPQAQHSGAIIDQQQQQLSGQVVATPGVASTSVLSQQQPLQQVAVQANNSTSSGAGAGVNVTAAANNVAAPQQIYYSLPTAATGGRPLPVLTAAPQAGALPLPAQFATAQQQQQVQTNQLNGVLAHDELLSTQQQQPTLVAGQNTSALLQQQQTAAGATVPVPTGNTTVLQSTVGLVSVPTTVANAVIPGFQQTAPIVAPHLLQQQQLQLSATPAQLMQATGNLPTNSTNANAVDTEENVKPIIDTSIRSSGNSINNTSVPKAPTPATDDFKTIHEQQQQEKYEAAKQAQNEPKTYANLFKSTSSSPSGFVNAALQQQQQLQQQQTLNNVYHSTSVSSASYTTTTSTSISTYNTNNNSSNNNSSNLNSVNSLQQRNSTIRTLKSEYEQRRQSNNSQFGDNQQLFLGNIPHHASEDDLKAIFSRFGVVLELRILSKPNSKLPSGVRNPQNYGFITYEDSESVQKCLANCPLYYPENSPDAQKLNVEEKKPRIRMDIPPRQQIGVNNSNLNNNLGRSIGTGNSGGPQSRSMANNNSGGNNNVLRNNTTNGGMPRSGNSGGGPRLSGNSGGGGFNRNDNRNGGGSSNGSLRGGNSGNGGGTNTQTGGNYGRR